jgi:hypothetical protein
MIKNVLILSITIGFLQAANAQSISNKVVANGGVSSTSGGFSIDYTVGELVVKTHTASGNMITEGFQQTYLSSSAGIDGNDIGLTVHVYPNPTIDQVNISLEGEKAVEFTATVFDGAGRSIYTNIFSAASFLQLNLQALAPGTYYVRLNDTKTSFPIKTIQIQKLSNQ